MRKIDSNDFRVVLPPHPDPGQTNAVQWVWLKKNETVQWIWYHGRKGSFVSGYEIIRDVKEGD